MTAEMAAADGTCVTWISSYCLVFAGQGPQHVLMGRQLAESYPAFFASIRENDRILIEKYEQDSITRARTGSFVPGIECKLVVLALVFIQIASVDLVKSLGIKGVTPLDTKERVASEPGYQDTFCVGHVDDGQKVARQGPRRRLLLGQHLSPGPVWEYHQQIVSDEGQDGVRLHYTRS